MLSLTPDLSPLMFIAYSGAHSASSGTTHHLHINVSGAVNGCVAVRKGDEAENDGELRSFGKLSYNINFYISKKV